MFGGIENAMCHFECGAYMFVSKNCNATSFENVNEIFDFFADEIVNLRFLYEERNIGILRNNKIYDCKCLKELTIVLIRDINQYETLYSTHLNESPVIFQINLDNYSDVSTMLDESTFSELEVEVRSVIMEWAKENRALLKKVRNDAYIALIQECLWAMSLHDTQKRNDFR